MSIHEQPRIYEPVNFNRPPSAAAALGALSSGLLPKSEFRKYEDIPGAPFGSRAIRNVHIVMKCMENPGLWTILNSYPKARYNAANTRRYHINKGNVASLRGLQATLTFDSDDQVYNVWVSHQPIEK